MKVWYMYSGLLCSSNKERYLDIWDNVDEPGGCYTEWNESGRERPILFGFTDTWNLKQSKQISKQNKNRSLETETKGMVTRGLGLGRWLKRGRGMQSTMFWQVYWWQVVTRVSGMVTLQGVKMLNHHIVHLKLIQPSISKFKPNISKFKII